MDWPEIGVYSLFEPGETLAVKSSSFYVVRVGASIILWERIHQHKGTLKSYGGYHHEGTHEKLTLEQNSFHGPTSSALHFRL